MAARNASVLGDQQTRFSYALVGSGVSSTGERGRNGVSANYRRSQRRSFDAAGQAVGGRQTLMVSKRRSSGSPEVVEFQYKKANGRFERR